MNDRVIASQMQGKPDLQKSEAQDTTETSKNTLDGCKASEGKTIAHLDLFFLFGGTLEILAFAMFCLRCLFA